MEIACKYFVDETKYTEYNFGKNFGLNIGDIWLTLEYMFDTDDFTNGKGFTQFTQSILFLNQKNVKNISYTVSPLLIVFYTDIDVTVSINRKTLEILEEQTTPTTCSIAELDTSENVF
jgi:hypothetical protein